jgi:pimeloyl-ACP methyl ester carboxylesterase
MGYSMGGWIGFHLGIGSPQRFLSMIIGGAHPYPEDLSDVREIAKQGAASILEYWDDVGAPLSSAVRRRLVHQPAFPLAAIVRKDRPDLSQWLHKMRMPTLIYAGDRDFRYQGVKDCVKDLPKATWVSLSGLDHLAAMARSDVVLPHLYAFLDRVNATVE